MNKTLSRSLEIRTLGRGEFAERLPIIGNYLSNRGCVPLSYHPGWLNVLEKGLGHSPYCLEAVEDGKVRGFLALAFVRSVIFGRFLVSLPYLNYGGPVADDDQISLGLIDLASDLARSLDVNYLELREEQAIEHPALDHTVTEKVHMRLPLPETAGALWDGLSAKVRNQVRKGQKSGLTVLWGRDELLPEFHAVFSRNMRDLGTPAYGRSLFREVLRQFPEQSEFCVVRLGDMAVAAAMLIHGWGVSEVPSASSLRAHNHTNANMLMYWNLLERAVSRGQGIFDFGRSSLDSNTYRFKLQWGAKPAPTVWQYHLRRGGLKSARPDNPRYQRLIRIWQQLPVGVTRLAGPVIARGIP
jgi:FemAB-related protein (PEP-CTERM system-associated)